MKELPLQDGEQVLLIDQRGKRHLLFLRKSETFHSDRGWISHDAVIGQPEGSWVRSSMGLRHLALRPTLAEFVLDMPRGAQVIYPKDLAMILFWADVYPGCRVLEAGTGSGALTLALLRAVGSEGRVITFEQRDEFARRALANIHMRCGEVTNLTMRLGPVEEGVGDEEPVDRVVLDLPEPWRLTQAVARAASGRDLSLLRPDDHPVAPDRRGAQPRARVGARGDVRNALSALEHRGHVRAAVPPDGGPHGIHHGGPPRDARGGRSGATPHRLRPR